MEKINSIIKMIVILFAGAVIVVMSSCESRSGKRFKEAKEKTIAHVVDKAKQHKKVPEGTLFLEKDIIAQTPDGHKAVIRYESDTVVISHFIWVEDTSKVVGLVTL